MKELLIKEFKLTGSVLTYIFAAFALMGFIPGYPILVSGFFVCLGILYTFQFAREYNDTLFTVMLPVNKSDAVKSRYAFCVIIQMLSFIISIAVVTVRMTILGSATVYTENVLMSANIAYLAYLLIIFGLFNTIFIGGFFKTAYYYGKYFVFFAIGAFLVVAIGETMHHIPGFQFMNNISGRGVLLQAIFFAAAAVFYIAGTLISMKGSIYKFERIDL